MPKCKLRRGAFGNWVLAHPDNPNLGWSGSRWVPMSDDGMPTGVAQVSSFTTEDAAYKYAGWSGFDTIVVDMVPTPKANEATVEQRIEEMELYAWIGEDEHGSGEIGLKQGYCPAGYIPLVAVRRDKVQKYLPQMEAQAQQYGKRIRLVRFIFSDVIVETRGGE